VLFASLLLARSSASSQEAIGRAGGVDVVLIAMRRHCLVEAVQWWGLKALTALLQHECNKQHCLRSDATAVVRQAMSAHAAVPQGRVLSQGRAVLDDLTS
jgi:hypothetical protein